MLLDWFTIGAQALNFLILVWLLKHFLYQPILHAIDAREKLIAKELADADAKKSEAQKERDAFQKKRNLTSNAPRCWPRRPTTRTPNGSGCWKQRARRPMP